MRTMYDSVTATSIPSSATLVAGYVDGHYANIPALQKRFPHAIVVHIATSWRTRAQVLDVEKGDATPEQAVQWCRQTMADTPNSQLTIYCSASVKPQVVEAFRETGTTLPQFWIAQWDNKPTLPTGAVAKQYKNGSSYDTSVVATAWPGVDPVDNDNHPFTYTVKQGDTLSAIALAHGTTWQKLAQLNALNDPDLIFPGQVIRLR